MDRRVARDALLAAGACVLDLVLFSNLLGDPGGTLRGSGAWGMVLIVGYAVAGYSALLWRRRFPVAVFAILWVHSLVALPLPGYRPTVGLLVALYTVSAYRSGWVVPAALCGALVTSGVTVVGEVVRAQASLRQGTAVGVGAFFAVVDLGVWAVGRWVFANRRHLADLEYRRRVEAREAVNAERARIARELHDIVSHAVTVMVLHAAGAQRVPADQLDRVRAALGVIDAQGRQAMAELRRLLTVLRTGDAPEPPVAADGVDADVAGDGVDAGVAADGRIAAGRAVVPGLADLDSLVAGIRDTGIGVRVQVEGRPRELDPGLGLTAYRVVQESLTNAARHSGPGGTATVRFTWADSELRIDVADDGRGRGPVPARGLSTGHGLIGLRERVAVVGGNLEVFPAPQGFRVSVQLPIDTLQLSPAPAGPSGGGER